MALSNILGHLMLLLSCALYKFKTMYANVLKFYICRPQEKTIVDPYFFVFSLNISHYRIIIL